MSVVTRLVIGSILLVVVVGAMRDAGAPPDMVAVGNETTDANVARLGLGR